MTELVLVVTLLTSSSSISSTGEWAEGRGMEGEAVGSALGAGTWEDEEIC